MSKDFKAREEERTINAIGASEAAASSSSEKKAKRSYKRLDPREPAPEEYHFTLKLPGEYGRYLSQKAYLERITITELLNNLVAEDMEKNPHILRDLDKEAKKRKL